MPAIPLSVVQGAIASAQKWHTPASVTIAQWALESNYGHQMPIGSNNPFGIKAKPGESFVTAATSEHINGRQVIVQGKFRKFPSIAAAFDDHGRLLSTAPAYARARCFLKNPDAFADALTGVYATDPHYGSKLKKIMKDNHLYQYDTPGRR